MGTLFRRTQRGNYYGEFTDSLGNRIRKSTGTSNKQDAARILANWEREANHERHGIAFGVDVALEDLLKQYLDYLGNTGDVHRDKTEARIRRVIDANDWTRPPHVNQLQLETTVRSLVSLRDGKPLAMRTQGGYITAWKAFSRWLTTVRKVYVRDPLAAVKKPGYQHDRKLVRRFLLPDEWPWLARCENALLYETAIQTGLRANELRHLSHEHIGADHLLLPAKYTKNRQPAKQYITAKLRSALMAAELPFALTDRLAEQLRDDLAFCRQAYECETDEPDPYFLQVANALGHVLDFHALRHTCGAWLAMRGCNPKVIQHIMRHSTITLTLDTYGHLMPHADRDAIQHFGELMP